MTTREEALAFGLSYPDTCQDAPFHDPNWQLVRIKSSKKVFLWTYEKDGYINLNVKADPEWRDYWRSAFASVTAGYHLNKEHWSTIILDGTVPDDAIKNMIDESYRMVTDSPTKRIYEAVKKIPKGKVARHTDRLPKWQEIRVWQEPLEMHSTKIQIHLPYRVIVLSIQKVSWQVNLCLAAQVFRHHVWQRKA